MWRPDLVRTRFGHETHASPQQSARKRALGIIAETNMGSNIATGSLSQTEGVHVKRAVAPRYYDH